MQLQLFRHLWGVDLTPGFDKLFGEYQAFGYAGIETAWVFVEKKQDFWRALQGHGMRFIPQLFSHQFRGGGTVNEHIAALRRELEALAEYPCEFANVQGGSDAWSLEEALDFYGQAFQLETEFGVTLVHETHRMCYFFNPWYTRNVLKALPDLQICCDLSHWVCVGERLLEDAGDIIALAAQHCRHVHARVGYPEGPQVPDPRAPEYQTALDAHEAWWRIIWKAQRARGIKVSTLTPEFGPAPYLHTLPHTNVPVADLNEICNWQAGRQREHFQRTIGEPIQ